MADKKNDKKSISRLGEFKLIELLTKGSRNKNSSTLHGIGDDAAVTGYKSGCQLITTDLLTEGVHFDLMYSPMKHLGYKAAIVNFSDIYAMNGRPKQMTVAIAVSRKISLPMLEKIYEGLHLACERYDVDLVGGDTSTSITGMHIMITVVGECDPKRITYRKGAKVNDLICVSGDLGASYMGLQLLEREKKVFQESRGSQPDLSGNDYILERQLKPEAREDIIELLGKEDIVPTSMIDLSDGLSSDLMHICKQSNAGCRVYSDKIPIHPDTVRMAEEFHLDGIIAALNGGEDYELAFTVPVEMHDKVSALPGISVIGHITDAREGKFLVTPQGQTIELQARGWDSFNE